MKINIHAGHTSSSGLSQGATGIINESDEARIIVYKLIELLESHDHVVYDCTSEGISEADNLNQIVNKCNQHKVDLDVSIHFNAFNGNAKGSEVWTYSSSNNNFANKSADKICKNLELLGFVNRGVKHSDSLYVLRNTIAPALLLEICFVDNENDCTIYNNSKDKIATAIASAITNEDFSNKSENNSGKLYRVQVGSFKDYNNAINYSKKIKEAGFDCFIVEV